MSCSPFFTIVIPAYNVESSITKTLTSVFNQTFTDYEIIVINDGSTDGTLEELSKIKDPRLHIFSQENAGVSVARNHGIARASGHYIALLDGDDLWMKNHLELACYFFKKNSEVIWYAPAYKNVSGQQNLQEDMAAATPEDIHICDFLKGNRNTVCSSSVFIKASEIKEEKIFPEGIKYYEDIIAWNKIAIKHPLIGILEIPTVFYCTREGSFIDTYKKTNAYAVDFSPTVLFLGEMKKLSEEDITPEAKYFLHRQMVTFISRNMEKANFSTWLPVLKKHKTNLGTLFYLWYTLFAYASLCLSGVFSLPFAVGRLAKRLTYYRRSHS